MPLSGKKILFFGPKTFNYEKAISSCMKDMGADVTFRSDKPSERSWVKGFIRLFPKIATRVSDRYFLSWLEQEGPKRCDTILIVKGEGLSSRFISLLRKRYPEAKIILYLWDSMSNVRGTDRKLAHVDEFFTFDPGDFKRVPSAKYRPLFFLEGGLDADAGSPGKSLFFLGTLNGDRPRVLSRVIENLPPGVDFRYWLFVRSRLELALRKLFDTALVSLDPSHLIFKPMPYDELTHYMRNSLAVLDIEHPKQVGLTMRTFEVLASGRKLVTTNKSIADHHFYDPQRVCVVDRESPSIPTDFFEHVPDPLPPTFFRRYSIKGWVSEILGIESF